VNSLGRNLAACPAPTGACNATVTVNLVAPNSMFEPRGNQIDARLTKLVRFGRWRLRGNVDVFNITNAGDVQFVQTRYGPTYLQPFNIMAGRLIKVSAQLDF
jgi:hypothetical protein